MQNRKKSLRAAKAAGDNPAEKEAIFRELAEDVECSSFLLPSPSSESQSCLQLSDEARDAIAVLRREFKIVSHDERLTTTLAQTVLELLTTQFATAAHKQIADSLQRVIEVLGRPSGSSPPMHEPHLSYHEGLQSTPKDYEQPSDSLPPLPAEPSKKWLRDRLPDETAPEFVVRVYGSWLEEGRLSRAYLQKDPPLYNALRKYIKKAKAEGLPLPQNFNLPSRHEASATRQERLGVTSATEALQRAMEAASPEVKELLLTYHSLRRSRSVHAPATSAPC